MQNLEIDLDAPDLSAQHGTRLLALSYLDDAAEAAARLQEGRDADALHDFRVSLRKLRGCLRAYREFVKEAVSDKLRRKIRKLARSTGKGRDAEVKLALLEKELASMNSRQKPGVLWLMHDLDGQRKESYRKIRRRIGRKFELLERKLRKRLSIYRMETGHRRGTTFAKATGSLIRRHGHDLERALAYVHTPLDRDEIHEARIQAKKLRYLVEPFSEKSENVTRLLKRLKYLQNLLGELHDLHVLSDTIGEALEIAAAKAARTLFEKTLSEGKNDKKTPAQNHPDFRSGLMAVARDIRKKQEELFAGLEMEWLGHRNEKTMRDTAILGLKLSSRN